MYNKIVIHPTPQKNQETGHKIQVGTSDGRQGDGIEKQTDTMLLVVLFPLLNGFWYLLCCRTYMQYQYFYQTF